jgi:hypothetical protein
MLAIGVLGLGACRLTQSHDRIACASVDASDSASTLRVELVVDMQAALVPTTMRVSTQSAPTPGVSRVLLHRRDGRHVAAGDIGGLRCAVGGHVLGRVAMLDVLTDRPAILTVRRQESGQVLLERHLAPQTVRADVHWMP